MIRDIVAIVFLMAFLSALFDPENVGKTAKIWQTKFIAGWEQVQ